jgi:hypothetical protein
MPGKDQRAEIGGVSTGLPSAREAVKIAASFIEWQ